jgi:ribosomal-protein-serine acetyltransferase
VLIPVRPGVELRSITEADAPDLDCLIEANREHLGPFMPWIAGHAIEGTRVFIRSSLRQEAEDDGFQAVILVDGELTGVAGFHRVDRINQTTSIGYWMDAAHQGRGVMTATVGALVDYAFDGWGLHRVELRIAPTNTRSRAVAARLGFREEGLMRGAERFGDGDYRDLILHSLLRSDQRAWAGAT